MSNGLTNGSHSSGLSAVITSIQGRIGSTVFIDGINYDVKKYEPGIKMNPTDFETIIIGEDELQYPIRFIGLEQVTIGELLIRMSKMFTYQKNQLIAYALIAKRIKILVDDRVVIQFNSGEYYSLYNFYLDLKNHRPGFPNGLKLSIATLKNFLAGKGRVVNSPNHFAKRRV